MDYIIVMQSFRDDQGDFLPKEVAAVCLQERNIGHWIVRPPCKFNKLPPAVKKINDRLRAVHGLHWFDGGISLGQLVIELRNVAKQATRIYTHGLADANFLEIIVGSRVIELSGYSIPTHSQLEQRFSPSLACTLHANENFAYNTEFCALTRAGFIKKWFKSILPAGWRLHPTIDSNLIHSALLKWCARTREIHRPEENSQGQDTVDADQVGNVYEEIVGGDS